MSTSGQSRFGFEPVAAWPRLPAGMMLRETPGVAVGPGDEVYALTRNPDIPVLVFNREGSLLRGFGRGIFSERTHAILVGPDGAVYCADDGTHTITKFSPTGELLLTIGAPRRPATRWSGQPFNQPTQAAVSGRTGAIYVTDGYGNAHVHKFGPDGRYIRTWGGPGIDAGQFMIPHNIAVDSDDRVYVADREAHRVQIFDADGNFLTMWNNIHRPCGLCLGPDGNIYIGELNGIDLVDGCPGYGHRVSVYSPSGDRLARFGEDEEGEEPGSFIAPHGIAVDSEGDVYVGEVSFTTRGHALPQIRELRSLSKLRRVR